MLDLHMLPLSTDLRKRIVARYRQGTETYKQVAALFGVGEATVSRLLRREREQGDLRPEPHGGGFPPRISDEELPALVELVAENPDSTLSELCLRWKERFGGPISISSMHRALKRAGITRKKKSFHASEQDREDVVQKRRKFAAVVSRIEPKSLVFIDESGFNVAMAPRYGRGLRGARVHGKKPINRGKNFTVVGAISNNRVICHRTFEGAMNTHRFIDFVHHHLCPRLAAGSVVVLDNLRPHHAAQVREAIEARGCRLLYLPPYSPELNPIEQCWSFIKAHVRRCAKRTIPELKQTIRDAFLRVRTSQLLAWCAHLFHILHK